jgi:hypothetical protein
MKNYGLKLVIVAASCFGYDVKGGKKSLKTEMVREVTARSGVYQRKKKQEIRRQIRG